MEPLVVITQAELRTCIEQAVQASILAVLPEAVRRATQKPFLTKAELMALTGWSARQVQYKKQKGEIPFVQRGRLILFETSAIHAYLQEGYVPPPRKYAR